jgi:crotonobetainyl-CoA:carnitine CoA-transferase CaiB-like acyl-CoA transferase
MGAEVIKVEPPRGDVTREIGDVAGTRCGPMFLSMNRGKLGVVLDLHDDADRRRFERLLADSDVFMHNRRPLTAQRLGIDYPTAKQINPAVIHCAMVGFGSEGPYAERAAYDDVIQAAAGVAAVQTGGGEPAYVRTVVADKVTGLLAVGTICAALYERATSGLGQAIEVPMFETMISFMALEQLSGLVFDPPQGPSGYARTSSPYRRPYRTADGLIGVVVYTDDQWRKFFELVGQADLMLDERFSTMRARTRNIDELYAFLEAQLTTHSTADWLAAMEHEGIPASPVNSIDDLLQDEHVIATRLFETDVQTAVGTVRTARFPATFSRTQLGRIRPAPTLGEHNAWLFAEADGDE